MTNHNFFSGIDAFLGSKVVVEWFALQISILVQSNYQGHPTNIFLKMGR